MQATMQVRIANWLLAAAVLICFAGVAGFTIGSAPADWGEVADGARWYLAVLRGRESTLLPLLAAAGALSAVWIALALRNRARHRGEVALRAATPRRPNQQHLLRRAYRQIDDALGRGEAALDCLLGALVDLNAAELRLEPGEMLIKAVLVFSDGRVLPLRMLTKKQFETLLREASLVSGVAEGQEGELELRSSSGADRIGAGYSRGSQGSVLQFRLLEPGSIVSSTADRPRRRSVLLRHDPTPPLRRPTGERARSSYSSPDEHTDSGAGVLTGLEPSAEIEISPVVARAERRPVRGAEAVLRSGRSLLLLASSYLIFAPTQVWAMRRLLRGEVTAPWREVEVLVRSRPSGARVHVSGELDGRRQAPTPESMICAGRELPSLDQPDRGPKCCRCLRSATCRYGWR